MAAEVRFLSLAPGVQGAWNNGCLILLFTRTVRKNDCDLRNIYITVENTGFLCAVVEARFVSHTWWLMLNSMAVAVQVLFVYALNSRYVNVFSFLASLEGELTT